MFQINQYDFTKCILADSYMINRVDEYNTWKDGNGVEHRDPVRSKVVGSLTLHFRSEEYRELFQLAMTRERHSSGYFPVIVDINNTGEEDVLINAFLTSEPVKRVVGNMQLMDDLTISVQEA